MNGFLDLGFYISFSGTVTFPKAVPTHDCARQVPDDRFLVETDCPFLAPVPRRGKRNEPAFVAAVAARVAELRGVELDTVAAQSTANARRLFGLPDGKPLQGRGTFDMYDVVLAWSWSGLPSPPTPKRPFPFR